VQVAYTTGKNFLPNCFKKSVAEQKKNQLIEKITNVLFLGEIKASAYTISLRDNFLLTHLSYPTEIFSSIIQ
jgi:hypothetical protein